MADAADIRDRFGVLLHSERFLMFHFASLSLEVAQTIWFIDVHKSDQTTTMFTVLARI